MGLAETFKCLSDQQRREILTSLKEGRKNAGELAEQLDISPQAVSYHLKLLKQAELVVEFKEKNFIFYELNTTVFTDMLVWLGQFGGENDEQ